MTESQTVADTGEAEVGFQRSITVSGIRCILTYVVFPFVAPLVGLAAGVGAVVGLIIGTVSIAANIFSIRRFQRADHRLKRPVTALHLGVIVLLAILFYRDVATLIG